MKLNLSATIDALATLGDIMTSRAGSVYSYMYVPKVIFSILLSSTSMTPLTNPTTRKELSGLNARALACVPNPLLRISCFFSRSQKRRVSSSATDAMIGYRGYTATKVFF